MIFILLLISLSNHSQTICEGFNIVVDDSLQQERYNAIRARIYEDIPAPLKESNAFRGAKYASWVAYDQARTEMNQRVVGLSRDQAAMIDHCYQALMPDSLKGKIHIRVLDYPNFETEKYPSHDIFINQGAFAELYSIDVLAAYVCKKIAHRVLQHYAQLFYLYDSGSLIGSYHKNSTLQQFEIESDELALDLYTAAGFEAKKYLELIAVLRKLDGDFDLLNRYTVGKDTQRELQYFMFDDRFQALLRSINKFKDRPVTQKPYPEYYNVRKSFWPSIVEAYALNDVAPAIRLAFKFHLLAPYDVVFPELIMQCIRKSPYSLLDFPFITWQYFESEDATVNIKKPVETSLFEDFNPKYLAIGPYDLKYVTNKTYWEDSVPMQTYWHVFNRMYQQTLAYNCVSCKLDMALLLDYKNAYRKELLNSYLSDTAAKHKQLANNLLKSAWPLPVNQKRLVLLNDVQLLLRSGGELAPIASSLKTHQYIDSALAVALSEENHIVWQSRSDILALPCQIKQGLKTLLELSTHRDYYKKPVAPEEEYSADADRTVYRPLFSFLMNFPEIWKVFNYFQVSEIEFVNVEYTEVAKRMSDFESVHESLSIEPKSWFENPDRRGYLRFSSIIAREKPDYRYPLAFPESDNFTINKRYPLHTGIPSYFRAFHQDFTERLKRGDEIIDNPNFLAKSKLYYYGFEEE